MKRPNHVAALPGYRIELVFPDGTTGVIDLSDSVGKGVFAPLQDEAFFKTVHVGAFGQIAWSEDIEICSDAAHLELTGESSDESIQIPQRFS
jgi:hypothetical protein